MNINPHIFRAYDIRGIAAPLDDKPADLTEKTVFLIGRATAIYLRKKYGTQTMAVGSDNRLTSENLKSAYIKGLLEEGLKVTDIGMATSPMVYWTTCANSLTLGVSDRYSTSISPEPSFDSTPPPTTHDSTISISETSISFDSATNITASHNPKEYNGLKIVTKGAHSICGEELQEILKIINSLQKAKSPPTISENQNSRSNPINSPTINNQDDISRALHLDIWPLYLADLISRVTHNQTTESQAKITSPATTESPATTKSPAKITSPATTKSTSTHLPQTLRHPPKVVIDCGNGVAGKFAPELLRKLGCEVVELYCELDGNFPNHEANPEELNNMHDLIKATLQHHADLGIGFDGDGDRIGIVDEKGHHYSSDFMLLLLARDLLTRLPDSKIVFDVKVSQIIINDIKKHGGIPIMSRTGHSFIEAKMKEIGAPLAGEVSGHLFFAENYYGFDDALLAAAKILEILSRSNRTLSSHLEDLPKVCTTPEFKASCPDDKKFDIIKNLTEHFTKLYSCITIDGVRVNFDKNSWGAIRASNTSPNLTLRFEAPTQEELKKIQKTMVAELQKYPEVSLDWYQE